MSANFSHLQSYDVARQLKIEQKSASNDICSSSSRTIPRAKTDNLTIQLVNIMDDKTGSFNGSAKRSSRNQPPPQILIEDSNRGASMPLVKEEDGEYPNRSSRFSSNRNQGAINHDRGTGGRLKSSQDISSNSLLLAGIEEVRVVGPKLLSPTLNKSFDGNSTSRSRQANILRIAEMQRSEDTFGTSEDTSEYCRNTGKSTQRMVTRNSKKSSTDQMAF